MKKNTKKHPDTNIEISSEVLDQLRPASNDYINLPVFEDLKQMINETIRSAVDNCDRADTNTVSVTFDVDRDLTTEGQIQEKTGEVVKVFLPVEAKISLTSKKKIINEKVKTDVFTSTSDAFGGTKIERFQPSLFDPE
jgi:hypothetical protein